MLDRSRFRGRPALAARIVCGALLVAIAFFPALAAKKTPPAQPIDLNTATLKQLEALPGVGPTTARAIIEFRTRSGRFRRVNDLLVIRGISEAKFKQIRPYVLVGTPPPAAAAKSTSSMGSAKPRPSTAGQASPPGAASHP